MAKKKAAKKKVAKKTPTPKKKAKRGAPTKSCPDCKKEVHAAKGTCDCGYKFPAKKKKKKKRAKRAASSTPAVSAATGALSRRLAESIKIVEKAGGLEQAKKTLSAVKELEKLE